MKYGTWLWLWLKELWIDLATRPGMILPHLHRATWYERTGHYRCDRCLSAGDRVQRKGQRQAEILRRRLS